MSADSATVHADARVPHDHDPAAVAPGISARASDAERADVVAQLHAALGAGRLDPAETDERVAAAYAARHRDELAAPPRAQQRNALLTALAVAWAVVCAVAGALAVGA